MYLTILQLLTDGADPKLVKCPQSAILLATQSGCPDLLRHMVSYGADVNEKFAELLHYTPLDLVISKPFTNGNLEMIRTLLEVGADTCHRLKHENAAQTSKHGFNVLPQEGPTLLHAIISRTTDGEKEEQIRNEIINLLLKHNADPTAQFLGKSPVDYAMTFKLDILDVFIFNPATNLNAIINKENHTILVKLFSKDYFRSLFGIDKFKTITNLLLYGADPLIECFDGDRRYENVFEFANKNHDEMSSSPAVNKTKSSQSGGGLLKKGKGKTASNNKVAIKSIGAIMNEDSKKKDKATEASEYTETLNMMKDCARLLYVRWLQAKLLNELVDVIIRFKHRHWTMIFKEHKHAHSLGLWVTASRCLEIWDILKSLRKKKFTDENILRTLLRIVLFYQKRLRANKEISNMKAVEKDIIEAEVKLLMKEYKMTSKLTKEAGAWKRDYVKPELDYKMQNKYKICFECGLRLSELKMTCDFCGFVSFCNFKCMTSNFQKASGHHPCNERLMEKYLPPPEDQVHELI